jgi:hypothetical protein
MTRPVDAASLTDRYRAITAARLHLGSDGAQGFEAHLELLLPQHQLIINAASGTPSGAVRDALQRALAQLQELECRDPAVRATMQAKAA